MVQYGGQNELMRWEDNGATVVMYGGSTPSAGRTAHLKVCKVSGLCRVTGVTVAMTTQTL
jgi:hypothetical protein